MTLNGNPLAIVRSGTSSFVALSRTCPYLRTTLDVTGAGFHCPSHGATFDRTGSWVGGQRTVHMQAYTTTYAAAAGTLTIG